MQRTKSYDLTEELRKELYDTLMEVYEGCQGISGPEIPLEVLIDKFKEPIPAPTSGEIEIKEKLKFRWMVQGDRTPEIYGRLEYDHSIISGTGGFYRTPDPDIALERCKTAFPDRFQETVNE